LEAIRGKSVNPFGAGAAQNAAAVAAQLTVAQVSYMKNSQ
jgi:hypothetical protein